MRVVARNAEVRLTWSQSDDRGTLVCTWTLSGGKQGATQSS